MDIPNLWTVEKIAAKLLERIPPEGINQDDSPSRDSNPMKNSSVKKKNKNKNKKNQSHNSMDVGYHEEVKQRKGEKEERIVCVIWFLSYVLLHSTHTHTHTHICFIVTVHIQRPCTSAAVYTYYSTSLLSPLPSTTGREGGSSHVFYHHTFLILSGLLCDSPPM